MSPSDTGSCRGDISLALPADQEKEACRYARELRETLNGDRRATNLEMGQLTAAAFAEALGVGETQPDPTPPRTNRSCVKSGVFAEKIRFLPEGSLVSIHNTSEPMRVGGVRLYACALSYIF